MKIVFTGGGSGGHFYPIIAVAESVHRVIKEKKLIKAEMFFMSPTPYNEGMLFDNGIVYKRIKAGKIRRYFSLMNFVDFFKTFFGIFGTFFELFKIYPDVVFGKGGYGSFPTLLAARILRIPVVIHESDTVPGIVNKWAGKFAQKVAISYPETASFFPKKKVAHTGQPIRRSMITPITSGAFEFFKIDKNPPVIFIIGGSQGSETINNIILDTLPSLVEKYQIIHQAGKKNRQSVEETAKVVLFNNPNKNRYKIFGYLNELSMRMAAGTATLIISRAGSSIFEIASWGVPSIIIPIKNSNGNHQAKNAFSYARSGSCSVIEEDNLKPHVLISEIDRIISNPDIRGKMKESTKSFVKKDAANKIAEELISIALSHE